MDPYQVEVLTDNFDLPEQAGAGSNFWFSKELLTALQTVRANNKGLLSIADLAAWLGLSERKIYTMDTTGALPIPLHVGSRKLWRRKELEAWIDAGLPPRSRWEKIKQETAAGGRDGVESP